MQNMILLVQDATTNAVQASIGVGPSAGGPAALEAARKRFYPGQAAVMHVMPSGDYDGTIEVNGSGDGGTTFDQSMLGSTDLTTGKGRMVEVTVYEHMQVTTSGRTAGSVSVYLTKGS